MTRFSISLSEGIDCVIWSIMNSPGNDIVIPKLKSYRLTDIAKVVCGDKKFKFIGIRDGEKIHENMISEKENCEILDFGKYYMITRNHKKLKKNNWKKLKNFDYNSKDNKYHTTSELREIIKNN